MKVKLLIVDDNRELADILGEYLEEKGKFEIVARAENGLEALRYIRSTDIDLVILDLIMPKLDGIGVLEELSAMKLSKRPKIVVLSAVGSEEYTKKALSLGADYYILKPFDIEVFANRMIQLFDEEYAFEAEKQTAASLENPSSSVVSLELEISQFLRELGAPVNNMGYTYLKEAIEMAINDMTVLSGITKIIYPSIAEKFNTTESRVERSIRHVIEVLSTRNNTELWRKLFINTVANNKEKPTNGEFIGVVADAVRLKLKNRN